LLINSAEEFFYHNERILCIGVEDPDFYKMSEAQKREEMMSAHIGRLNENEGAFSILLSHRPELFPIYKKQQINLALTGHAHGGQFRLPMIGGLAAPNQGIFPKYDAGIFEEAQTRMIVSRGLGNSVFPLRVNNPPEIVVIKFTEK
jgi:predicted MPP superfamily phosphohydrolase